MNPEITAICLLGFATALLTFFCLHHDRQISQAAQATRDEAKRMEKLIAAFRELEVRFTKIEQTQNHNIRLIVDHVDPLIELYKKQGELFDKPGTN